ncbi:MAG: hypothetical protein GY870_18220, partial [archaeon]|nr:hypothetical protein [archaeon]
KPINRKRKELSKICMDEWKRWYVGHWRFPGVQQKDHIAMFPEELPYRLIRMFSFLNDTILDPFAGSGTTLKVAKGLGRKSIGYEINPEYKNIIERKSEEPFIVNDFHTIAKKLYQKEKSDITFDFKFSTQKSILCFKNHLDHKIVADFMSNSLDTSEKNFFENLKGKLEENNIKNYLSKKPAWQDIDRYWIIINIGSKKKQIIDELQVKINDWVEGNIEIINFDDFIENF